MRKLFQHPSKKYKQKRQSQQLQTHGGVQENSTHQSGTDIETDSVGDLPVLKENPTQHLSKLHLEDLKTRESCISMTNGSSLLEPVCGDNTFLQVSHYTASFPRQRDSGISVGSINSSTESINGYVESDLHTSSVICSKHPQHRQFIPVSSLNLNHLPEAFRKPNWQKLIQLKAIDVVRLSVSHTSESRPDDLGFKGVKSVRFGSGTAFVYKMEDIQRCDCGVGLHDHRVSGLFKVMTAAHVVFDDDEAKSTTVEFFYDSFDSSTIVRGWGVRVFSVDVERNRSVIECRTHDLELCQRLKDAQKQRNDLIKNELEAVVGDAQMAVLISHPHGMCKQLSFGTLKEKKIFGEVKTTKEGVQLVDCILTYDTPTCPGSGGGPVNVIGGGTTSYAFAPHCASKSNNESISGLGWARVTTG